MQKVSAEASSSQDIRVIQAAAEQMKEDADIIDLTYQSIAKYDIDAAQSGVYYEQPSTIQGSIHRSN